MANTPRLTLPLIADGQASAYIPHNNALYFADAFICMNIKDFGLDTPPGSPAAGDSYVLGSSPTGAWSGQASKIAVYASGWNFFTPVEGMRIWIADEDVAAVYDGTEWIDEVMFRGDYRTTFITDDFGGSTTFGNNISRFTSGTGAGSAAVEPDSTYGQNRFGLTSFDCGSTSTGRCGLGGVAPRICLGQGIVEMEWDIYVATLSNGTDRYILAFGLGDGNTTDAPANHALIKYTDNVNSGAWYFSASDNSSGSTTNGSGSAVSANTWYRLRMVINAAASSITFYVNGSSVGTHTTNIPTASGRGLDVLLGIWKTVGTATRLIVADRYWLRFRRSTPI